MNHRQIRYNNIRNALGILNNSIYIAAITPSNTIDPLFLYVIMMAIPPMHQYFLYIQHNQKIHVHVTLQLNYILHQVEFN